jgi:hypothetical protein
VSKNRYDDRRRKVHCRGHQSRTFLLCLFSCFSPEPQEIFNQKKNTQTNQQKPLSTQAPCTIREANLCQIFTTPAASSLPHPPHVQISATKFVATTERFPSSSCSSVFRKIS